MRHQLLNQFRSEKGKLSFRAEKSKSGFEPKIEINFLSRKIKISFYGLIEKIFFRVQRLFFTLNVINVILILLEKSQNFYRFLVLLDSILQSNLNSTEYYFLVKTFEFLVLLESHNSFQSRKNVEF